MVISEEMLKKGRKKRNNTRNNTRKAKGNLKKKELNLLHKAATKRDLDNFFVFSKKALNKINFVKPNKTMITNLYKNKKKTLKKIGKTLRRRSL
tara:strand:- start:5955 stop:6236 length:282 start_codon:yes stop_codon:yes gene_type:complete